MNTRFVEVILAVVLLASTASAHGEDAPPPKEKVCTPSLNHETSGPAYKPNQPRKNAVCAGTDNTGLYVVDENWCREGGYCWGRKWAEVQDLNIAVQGFVVGEDCKPINATMDLWQPDHTGLYGLLDEGEDDGFCRAQLTTKSDGSFEFTTQVVGTYGIMGAFHWRLPFLEWLEVPPYSPRHIHVMIHADGYVPFATQLYFDGDKTLGFKDAREDVGNNSLGTDQTEMRLKFHAGSHDKNGYATSDPVTIVLEKDTLGAYRGLSKDAAYEKKICNKSPVRLMDAPALCHPEVLVYISPNRLPIYIVAAISLQLLIFFVLAMINIVKVLFMLTIGHFFMGREHRPANQKKVA